MERRKISIGEVKKFWSTYKFLGIVSILSFLIIWFIFTKDGLGIIAPIKLPSPLMVIKAVVKLKEVILLDILATSARVLSGLLTGLIIGVGFGLLMSFYKKLNYFFSPLIESMRPVPVIAMIPFFLMWFGITEPGKFILIVLGVFNIMIINTLEAVKNVPLIYINAAQTLGADKKQIFKRIIIPAIIPELIGPIRVATALSFTLTVAAEFMGTNFGLGYRILDARRLFNTDVIFLGIVLFGIIASLFDMGNQKIFRYFTRWSERI